MHAAIIELEERTNKAGSVFFETYGCRPDETTQQEAQKLTLELLWDIREALKPPPVRIVVDDK